MKMEFIARAPGLRPPSGMIDRSFYSTDARMLAAIVFVIAGYLIGSISFAVVSSRIFGLPDPHTYGSRNPGATNVLRTGNRAAAITTLVGDAAKGIVAVALAMHYGPSFETPFWTVPAVALATFIGHLYPVFH